MNNWELCANQPLKNFMAQPDRLTTGDTDMISKETKHALAWCITCRLPGIFCLKIHINLTVLPLLLYGRKLHIGFLHICVEKGLLPKQYQGIKIKVRETMGKRPVNPTLLASLPS